MENTLSARQRAQYNHLHITPNASSEPTVHEPWLHTMGKWLQWSAAALLALCALFAGALRLRALQTDWLPSNSELQAVTPQTLLS